eukprot:1172228-Prymnesium_polylepis.1
MALTARQHAGRLRDAAAALSWRDHGAAAIASAATAAQKAEEEARVLESLRDMARRRQQTILQASRQKAPRSLLIVGYVDPCIERLKLASILNDPQTTGIIPDDVWVSKGKPMAAYALSTRPFWTLANFTSASRQCGRAT